MKDENLVQLAQQARKGDKASMQALRGVSDEHLDLKLEGDRRAWASSRVAPA